VGGRGGGGGRVAAYTVHTATAECSPLHKPNKKRRLSLTMGFLQV
jgi:hypothetical protein